MNDQPRHFQVPPLEKTIRVRCRPAHAFEAFTAEIGRWWPLSTHSVGEDKARDCAIEPHVGGRVFETDADGSEHVWGYITRWSPPDGFAMTWHPGRGPESAQMVDIGFTAQGEGTLVKLIHRGWESLGEARAAGARESYDQGWDLVLGQAFAPHANRGA